MKSKMLVRNSFFVVATITIAAIAAYASVTFDPSTGIGFIGRGDVISFVGKSGLVVNPAIQFTSSVSLEQECEKSWTTGGAKKQTAHFLQHGFAYTQTVNAVVSSETRQAKGNGNITGYLLTGFSGPAGDSLPASLCPDDNSGWVPSGSIVITDSTGGVLTFNGTVIPF
jgi:hypothetical protein